MIRRINRVKLAQAFGWSFEYIDSLDPADVLDIYGVWDGENRWNKYEQEKKG